MLEVIIMAPDAAPVAGASIHANVCVNTEIDRTVYKQNMISLALNIATH